MIEEVCAIGSGMVIKIFNTGTNQSEQMLVINILLVVAGEGKPCTGATEEKPAV